jgi:hypothetical protein
VMRAVAAPLWQIGGDRLDIVPRHACRQPSFRKTSIQLECYFQRTAD